jgi:hypothetical protein
MSKIIMDFLSDTAAAHANENIVMTTGSYDDYYGEIADVQVKSISALWRSLHIVDSDGELRSVYPDGEQIDPPFQVYDHKRNCYSDIVVCKRPLSDLPPAESENALGCLVNYIACTFHDYWENDDCGCSVELERDVVERERKERFDALQSLAASVLKDTGGVNLFEALAARVRDAEAYVAGLHEDGLCAVNPFSSSAVDDWCDLRNAAQGRVASEEELFCFCTSEYPLSYLAWQEAKLKAKINP